MCTFVAATVVVVVEGDGGGVEVVVVAVVVGVDRDVAASPTVSAVVSFASSASVEGAGPRPGARGLRRQTVELDKSHGNEGLDSKPSPLHPGQRG